MPSVKVSQVVNCDLEYAFDVVVSVQLYPNWNPTTKSAHKIKESPSGEEVGEGTTFLIALRGFGKQELVCTEFEKYKQVRLVPVSKMFSGGHRFIFFREGDKTRIEHELEMNPKGLMKLFTPMMGKMMNKNINETVNALQKFLERK